MHELLQPKKGIGFHHSVSGSGKQVSSGCPPAIHLRCQHCIQAFGRIMQGRLNWAVEGQGLGASGGQISSKRGAEFFLKNNHVILDFPDLS